MPETKTRTEAIEKLGKLIKGIRIAMLTTITPEGDLHARPMAAQEVEFDGTLWFFSGASSPKIEHIEKDSRVNAAFSNPEKQEYVSVAGRASLVRDRAKIEELWNPSLKAWFKDGLDDPDLALLRIDVDGAEYWDAPNSVVAHIAGFVKTKLGGEQNVGDHQKIDL